MSASARENLQKSLGAIAAWEPHIGAFLDITKDEAERQVAALESDIALHQQPLAGMPIAIKANIATQFGRTSASSKILKDFVSPFNATVVQRLLGAGAVVVGKTQHDEFAMGSSTEHAGLGPQTKNPWDISRVAGGSSGGSAAAVASTEVEAALGTDTGGSIRQPASLCGVVGVKPTYGRVSRHGLIAYGSSLDQAGPITRTVRDAAKIMEVISGKDPLDATSSEVPVGQYAALCGKPIAGMIIGMPKEFFADGIDPEVKKIVTDAIMSFEEQGAVVKEISLPLTPAAIAVYYVIAKAEASSNLARFDGLRYGIREDIHASLIDYYKQVRGEGFGPEVKRAIMMGTYALSSGYSEAWYGQASKVRTLIRREYEQAFRGVDVIAGPVSPEPAFKLGSKTSDPLAMYLADAYTVPASVAGLPAISVPCGMAIKGPPNRRVSLPVGLHIIAPHFQEETMFQIAAAFESAHEFQNLSPELPQ
ncbi:MAG: glutaminyl-tRNA synthase (glutamine-hydrolyzing) subunit A [Candidatus Andersenbacteria bacterium RIFCSPHIGHO2_12_FULL_45_11b]|uniref:Glutamyl-tRNA(Gln) amidotransferase subunit A n=1 Tax=Candidatus Andersenbacteria bacterium RIFCSPHIGHO2_12_FULL_45_11b TaxID=1797282 RepID=A0A1G1X7Q8_9BACT|nr:MAG: glutaminyl-tRNA synthase (glutamine-hydrolyzing) subunit A [Candidatus Andersenbacteria bacterium RIFCSPHIGHO2_12_FULL_45_11b]